MAAASSTSFHPATLLIVAKVFFCLTSSADDSQILDFWENRCVTGRNVVVRFSLHNFTDDITLCDDASLNMRCDVTSVRDDDMPDVNISFTMEHSVVNTEGHSDLLVLDDHERSSKTLGRGRLESGTYQRWAPVTLILRIHPCNPPWQAQAALSVMGQGNESVRVTCSGLENPTAAQYSLHVSEAYFDENSTSTLHSMDCGNSSIFVVDPRGSCCASCHRCRQQTARVQVEGLLEDCWAKHNCTTARLAADDPIPSNRSFDHKNVSKIMYACVPDPQVLSFAGPGSVVAQKAAVRFSPLVHPVDANISCHKFVIELRCDVEPSGDDVISDVRVATFMEHAVLNHSQYSDLYLETLEGRSSKITHKKKLEYGIHCDVTPPFTLVLKITRLNPPLQAWAALLVVGNASVKITCGRQICHQDECNTLATATWVLALLLLSLLAALVLYVALRRSSRRQPWGGPPSAEDLRVRDGGLDVPAPEEEARDDGLYVVPIHVPDVRQEARGRHDDLPLPAPPLSRDSDHPPPPPFPPPPPPPLPHFPR